MTTMTSNDIRVGVSHAVSNAVYNTDPARIQASIRDYMERQLARHLVVNKVEEHVEEYHRMYRLDLYAADPETFWRIVQEEAMKLEARRPIDPFARDVDAMRTAIAIYCREELGEIDFEDDAHAIKHFTDKYREENYR